MALAQYFEALKEDRDQQDQIVTHAYLEISARKFRLSSNAAMLAIIHSIEWKIPAVSNPVQLKYDALIPTIVRQLEHERLLNKDSNIPEIDHLVTFNDLQSQGYINLAPHELSQTGSIITPYGFDLLQNHTRVAAA